jgi:hypothetical protein
MQIIGCVSLSMGTCRHFSSALSADRMCRQVGKPGVVGASLGQSLVCAPHISCSRCRHYGRVGKRTDSFLGRQKGSEPCQKWVSVPLLGSQQGQAWRGHGTCLGSPAKRTSRVPNWSYGWARDEQGSSRVGQSGYAGVRWVEIIPKSNVAYCGPEISLPVSSTWKGRSRQNATILVF